MSKQLIKAFSIKETTSPGPKDDVLNVSEFFYDTIQGEGVYMGMPAAFLRLQNCTLSCTWCDTSEVWRHGNPYGFDELFDMIQKSTLLEKLKNRQHLVLTGGSPLKQQMQLINFFTKFNRRFNFYPIVEIENECTLRPHPSLVQFISVWNNSPKLSNSGNSRKARYKPKILKELSTFQNSWFKFVVSCVEDWEEIKMDYLDTGLIWKDQIILMPEGATVDEINTIAPDIADMAVRYNVRYATREHIMLWNQATGV